MRKRGVRILEELRINSGSEVEFLPGGFHSVSMRVTHNGKDIVVKVISNKPGLNRKLAAEALANNLLYYHELLVRAGVKVPPKTRVELLHNGKMYDVILIMPYTGRNAEEIIISASRTEALEVASMILMTIKPVLVRCSVNERSLELRVGIEPKPANLTLTDNGEMYYVDLMPPRFVLGREVLVEFTAPRSKQGFTLAYFRHFDIRGILFLLQTQLARLRPELIDDFKDLICEFAKTLPNSGRITRFLTRGKWEKVFKVPHWRARRIIDSLMPKDMYPIRHIACEAVARNPELYSEEVLEEIFRLSHFVDDVPNMENIRKARRILKAIVAGQPVDLS
jgi:hypothetical protein